MKRYLLGIFILFLSLFFAGTVSALDYQIQSYQGDLEIHADNTATYTEEVTYHFDDDYNGQMVSLGSAGKMPEGFAIDSDPKVSVKTNGVVKYDFEPRVTDLGDGYEVKIYNAGKEGDTVKVTVTWNLTNLLFLHKDIAELKWTPISDWEEELQNVTIKVWGLGTWSLTDMYVHTGYFGQSATINRDRGDYRIQLSHLPSMKKVELHGYWHRQALHQAVEDPKATNYLQTFQAVEKEIVAKSQFYHRLGEVYLPILGLFLLMLSGIFYLIFRVKIRPSQAFPKDARLYEAPQDLAPLIVAANIFAVDMREVDPTSGGRAHLKFENLVQATLLDLMDRGYIELLGTADKPILKPTSKKGLSEFEGQFLQMAFGDHKQAAVADLFESYQISEDLYKNKKSTDEARIRQIGNRIKNRFSTDLNLLSEQVLKEIRELNLLDHYRPLKRGEKLLLWLALMASFLAFGLSLLTFFVYLIKLDGFIWFYLPLAAIASVLTVLLGRALQLYQRDGVLSDEGAHDFYLWNSFANMLRYIARLYDTEVEGIVLWNRLLVYATLFGYADRVSRVMKLRQISLENTSMNTYLQYNLHPIFYASSHSFSNYGHIASTASHFSVSSGGGAGGGFSGGGGGGGGGAF